MKKILDICHRKKVWLQCEPFGEFLDPSSLKMTSSIVYKKMTCLCLQCEVFHFPHHILVEVPYLVVYFANSCSETEVKARLPCFSNFSLLIIPTCLS